ncbi:hypothetical protein AB4243_19715 [Enterovibrio norvegicus]|uniref:hypothetical protein n=1 Tax=Enterovibrio norvegicus TaxID=188144 RepID=UPI0035509EF3
MEPKQIVQKWVEAFNKGDADLITEFYSEGAINHQVANDPVVGGHTAGTGTFPTVVGVCWAKNSTSWLRFNLRLKIGVECSPTPQTWKLFLARSRPMVTA